MSTRRKSVLVSLLAIVFACSVAACSEQEPRSLVATGRPIVGGTIDDDPAHMATVALTNGAGTGYFCSGTLITDSVVLTAAHCLEDYWGNPVDPTGIDIFFGANAYESGTYRGVSEGLQHPDWNRQTLSRDIALLRLSTTAPAGIEPIPYLPASIGLTSSDEGVTVVDFSGFGLTETNSDGEKLHVSNVIDTVCDSSGGCGDVVQYAMGYDEDPGGPCSGDSGGPAYVVRNNVEYVAGVTSYGDQNCSYFGVSTMPDRYAAWIDAFIGGGGTEDCTNGSDDDGDDLVDCDDPDCATHPDCLGPSACVDAPLIGCGEQASGTTVGGAYNFVDWTCPEGSVEESGPEVAYRVDAPSGALVTATMQPGPGGDLDLFVVGGDADDCDQGDCITVSGETGDTPEEVSFTMPAGEVYIVIETWDNPTTFDLEVVCGEPEICDNDIDDDGDGLTDCNDPDCADNPACAGTTACTLAETIGCGEQLAADTSDGVSAFEAYSCLTETTWDGPEVAFFLDIPEGTDVVAEMVHGDVMDSSDLDMFLLPVQDGGCLPDACLDASTEPSPPEQITFTMPAGGAYLVVDTWQNATSFTLDIACSGGGENCTNGSDDDGDGLADCDDPDCSTHPDCQPESDCDNDVDDDGDGFTDCDDPDCTDDPACQATPEDCDNDVDDDGDGFTDCDDPDCTDDPACQATPEDCDNDVDDDGDGDVDCDDADCANDPACQATPEDCGNDVDDDGDGDVDCDDADCANDPACQATPEDCDNDVDDDGDGNVDCDDADCADDPACQVTPEDCDNDVDDDGDGDVDCDDADCADDPACQATPEDCDNDVDDDGDGNVDCDDADCAGAPGCTNPDPEICDNGIDDDGDGDIDCADADCDTDPACESTDGDGGCGCAASGQGTEGLAFLALFGLLLIARRRRP